MEIFKMIAMMATTLLLTIWSVCECVGIRSREKAGIEEARGPIYVALLAIAFDFFILALMLISPETFQEPGKRYFPWVITVINIVVYIPCSYRLTIDKDKDRLGVRLLFLTKHYPLSEVVFQEKGGHKIKYRGKTIFIWYHKNMECSQGLDRIWEERSDLHWQEQVQNLRPIQADPAASSEEKSLPPDTA